MPDTTEHVADVRALWRFTLDVLGIVALAFHAHIKRFGVEIAKRRTDFHAPFAFDFSIHHINTLHRTLGRAADGHFHLFITHRLIEAQHLAVAHRHAASQGVITVQRVLDGLFCQRRAGGYLADAFVGHGQAAAKPVKR